MPTFDSIFIDVVVLNTNVILSRSCDKCFFVGSQFYCDFIEKNQKILSLPKRSAVRLGHLFLQVVKFLFKGPCIKSENPNQLAKQYLPTE